VIVPIITRSSCADSKRNSGVKTIGKPSIPGCETFRELRTFTLLKLPHQHHNKKQSWKVRIHSLPPSIHSFIQQRVCKLNHKSTHPLLKKSILTPPPIPPKSINREVHACIIILRPRLSCHVSESAQCLSSRCAKGSL
jgi:hypothetical protein